MSQICTIGINYRTAPLELREMVAVSADSVADKLRHLSRRCGLAEAAILSTCNRTEVYCLSDRPQAVADWLAEPGGGGQYIYRLQSEAAVRHLFRVASGLDSQLLGEPEITGQVKQFAQLAQQAGTAGTIITRLMEHALAAAKAVRTQTDIGRHSLSYPALALRAASGIFPRLEDTAVLFVGSGDMTFAGAPIFADKGVRRLAIAGRNSARTQEAAARVAAEALPSARLPGLLAEFDIVISASNSQVPIIGKGAVESALKRRQHKPMMFADLAVPRDLEPEIQQLPDVFVYHLDQFAAMADESGEKRREAARQGEAIIDVHTRRFCRWLLERNSSERVRDFRAAAERMRDEETRAALGRLTAGVAPQQVIEELSRRLAGRLLHAPTQCSRQSDACLLHRFSGNAHEEIIVNMQTQPDESNDPEKTD